MLNRSNKTTQNMMWCVLTTFLMCAVATAALECATCEQIVALVPNELPSNDTLKTFGKTLTDMCDSMDPSQQDDCNTIADTITTFLAAIHLKVNLRGMDSATDVCAAIGFCQIDCCQTNTVPEQVHLAYDTNPNTITVAWVTLIQTDSTVQYGLSATALDQTATGTTQSFNSSGWVGVVHSASLVNLIPGKRYFYRVGGAGGWSVTTSFNNIAPTRFVVIGDLGAGPLAGANFASLKALVDAGSIDAILHVGDVAYSDGVERIFDDYMRQMEPIASRVPYMILPGNHELPFGFSSFRTRFLMPGYSTVVPVDGETQMPLFWSVDLGTDLLHVIGCNTESMIDSPEFDQTQVDWLTADLAAASAAGKKWIVYMGHRPLYCSSNTKTCDTEGSVLRGVIEDLLNKHHVDLGFTGHVHNYERMLPMYNGTVTDQPQAGAIFLNPTGTTWIVSGAGGNREDPDPISTDPPAWSAFQYQNWGYGVMVLNEGQMDWDFYDAVTRLSLDHMRIVKNKTDSR